MPAQPAQQGELCGQAAAGLRRVGPSGRKHFQRLIGGLELGLQQFGCRDAVVCAQALIDRSPPGSCGFFRLIDLGVEIAHLFEVRHSFVQLDGLGPQAALLQAAGGRVEPIQPIAIEHGRLAPMFAGHKRPGSAVEIPQQVRVDIGRAAVAA